MLGVVSHNRTRLRGCRHQEHGAQRGELSSPTSITHPGDATIRTVRQGPAGDLQQAEFSRPADRRAAVLNAELAVHGALVGLHGIERDVEPLTDLTPR